VSDVVVKGEIPDPIRRSVELWIGCLSGALEEKDYLAGLASAGFADASIEPTRVYRASDARTFLEGHGIDVDAVAPLVDGPLLQRLHPRDQAALAPRELRGQIPNRVTPVAQHAALGI